MAITEFTTDVNNIQRLLDKPNAAGMSSSDLKAQFDKAGSDIQTYINGTLTKQIDNKFTAVDNTISNINTTITNIQNAMLNFSQIYPVGSIYISVNSTNPATLFGGTWERIQNRFLLASGSSYANGSTGGSATHKLTINEMPSHNHNFHGTADLSAQAYSSGTARWPIRYVASSNMTSYVANAGGGQSFSIMPPYLAVYVWKRTR